MGSFAGALLCILCPCLWLVRRRQKRAYNYNTAAAPGSAESPAYGKPVPQHQVDSYDLDSPQLSFPSNAHAPPSRYYEPVNEWRVNVASQTPRSVSLGFMHSRPRSHPG